MEKTAEIQAQTARLLTAAGTVSSVAHAQAALLASAFQSFAARTGTDALALFQRYGLDVQRVDRENAFSQWFRDSKIVDAAGDPVVCYHGTPSRAEYSNNRYVRSEQAGTEFPLFDEFETKGGGFTDGGWLGQGAYFTPDPEYAEEFGDILVPVYLAIRNPFVVVDDNSNSQANRFRFLKSIQDLPELPPEYKLDLSMPQEKVGKDLSGREYRLYYRISEMEDERGRKSYGVVSSSRPDANSGIVEGSGDSPEEAIFAWRYKWERRFSGFLLHIIGDIGAGDFTAMLKKAGYDGVIKKDEKGRISEVLAFEPEQIKSAVGNAGTFDPNNPSILRQDARGAIQFDGTRSWFHVFLTEQSDVSTFLHEAAHLYLEVMQDVVTRGEAASDLANDLAITREWLGVPPGEPLSEEHHEQWARAVEAYLIVKEAPSSALASVFGRFKGWLKDVYSSVSELDVQLDDKICGVFDRLFHSTAAAPDNPRSAANRQNAGMKMR